MEKRCLAGTLENLIGNCRCLGCEVLRELKEELKVHDGERMSLAGFDLLVLRYLMRAWDRRVARMMTMDRLEQMDPE